MSNYVTNQEVREQAGFQYKQRSESLGDGDGVNKIFSSENNPIVDRNYSGSPVSVADVIVYVNGTAVTVSAIDADTGKLTLALAPADGTSITVDYDWSNIEFDVIENYVDEAHALVLASIQRAYSLPLSETPDLLILIEKKLAAGLLLDKEYSVGGDETEDSRGRRWIKWAETKLAEIAKGSLQLLNSEGGLLTQNSAQVSGWPDNTTECLDEDDSGGDIPFRIEQKF